MENENGIYKIPCIVNGTKMKFILDTGASHTSISLSEALFLIKNGTLSNSDIKGSTYTQLANGEIIENTKITIKEFVIGDIIFNNVEALVVNNLTAPLLLGQSTINKLGKFEIEGNKLILSNYLNNDSIEKIVKLKLVLAEKAYDNKLFEESLELYKEINNYKPNLKLLSLDDLYKISDLFYKNELKIESLLYLNEIILRQPNSVEILNKIGDIYIQKDISENNAIMCYKKALFYSPKNITAMLGLADIYRSNINFFKPNEDDVKKLKLAIGYLNKIISIEPNNYKALCMLGVIYVYDTGLIVNRVKQG